MLLNGVNENALKIELKLLGFNVETQKEILVNYKGIVIGKYFADLVVDNKIIIELKCVSEILPVHKAQLLNYLKATGYRLEIIINFPNDRMGFDIERVPNFME
jgi:GxxExxY protein